VAKAKAQFTYLVRKLGGAISDEITVNMYSIILVNLKEETSGE
jgi:hypothetical protein